MLLWVNGYLSTWIQYEWRWVYRHIPLELLNSYWTLYINPSSQTIFCLLYYIPGSTAEKQLAHTPILWFTCLTWAVNICNVGFRRRVNLKVEKVQVIPRVGSSQISYEGIVELLLFIMIWLMSRLLANADDQIIQEIMQKCKIHSKELQCVTFKKQWTCTWIGKVERDMG